MLFTKTIDSRKGMDVCYGETEINIDILDTPYIWYNLLKKEDDTPYLVAIQLLSYLLNNYRKYDLNNNNIYKYVFNDIKNITKRTDLFYFYS
jgi:hypothetical protein